MEDLVIKKKDLENLGIKVMKEVYKFLHDEYILSFEKMKEEKDKLEKYLVKFYYKDILEKYTKFFIEDKYVDEITLKEIEAEIEAETLNINFIFDALNRIKVSSEINGDLYCKKKVFKYNYLVFDFYHTYLKD